MRAWKTQRLCPFLPIRCDYFTHQRLSVSAVSQTQSIAPVSYYTRVSRTATRNTRTFIELALGTNDVSQRVWHSSSFVCQLKHLHYWGKTRIKIKSLDTQRRGNITHWQRQKMRHNYTQRKWQI